MKIMQGNLGERADQPETRPPTPRPAPFANAVQSSMGEKTWQEKQTADSPPQQQNQKQQAALGEGGQKAASDSATSTAAPSGPATANAAPALAQEERAEQVQAVDQMDHAQRALAHIEEEQAKMELKRHKDREADIEKELEATMKDLDAKQKGLEAAMHKPAL